MAKFLPRMRRSRLKRSERRPLQLEPLEHRFLMDAGGAELADDVFEVLQNGAEQSLDLLGNDAFTADYSGAQRITSVSYGSEGGRVVIADDGLSVLYTPPADFSGNETFAYYVDNQLSANVTVTILPLLAPDQYQFPPDGQARTLDVLANDPFWPDYQGLGEITVTSEPLLGGELEIAADGKSLIYTPPRYAFGKEAFVYIVDDLYPAQVRIEIPNPLEPDRFPDIVQQSENNRLNVLANDTFWTGYLGDRTITHVIQPGNGGTVAIAGNGKALFYTPAPDFSGSDQFRYVVDGSFEANVTLQVHRPVKNDRYEVDTNTTGYPLYVTTNDRYSFYNGSVRIYRDVVDRVTWVGDTAHGGTVTIMSDGRGVVYSAPPDFEGEDTFDYIADDKYRATVVVNVTRPVRDDYITHSVYEDTAGTVLYVLRNDFHGNGYSGPKVITSVSETSEGGTVTIADNGISLVYTPPNGFRGMDTLNYTVDDEFQAEVRVRVNSLAEYDSYSRLDPYPLQDEYVLHVLANDHFKGGYQGPGVITAVSEVTNGGLVTISDGGRSVRFVPGDGDHYRFNYTVDDTYEASVYVSFKNFLASDSFVVDQNSQATEFDVMANDFRSSWLGEYLGPREITAVGPSQHGATVTIAADGQTVLFAPAPDFVGADSFSYTVDGIMTRDVKVQVIRRVRDDVFRVETDSQENALPVLVNDLFGADYSGAGRVTDVTESAAGAAVTVAPDGRSALYTPPADYVGRDTFTYTVDGALKAEVTVWVGTTVEDLHRRFGSLAEMEQFLLDEALARYEHMFGQAAGSVIKVDDGLDSVGETILFSNDATRTGGRIHSETNVQVAGVDEGDIIETDGDYLYVLSGSELIIAQAWPAEELSIASRLTIDGSPIAEYLNGDRLTVVSRSFADPPHTPGPIIPYDVTGAFVSSTVEGFSVDQRSVDPRILPGYWPTWGATKICVTVFDVSDRESPTIVEQTKFDGEYVESRRIDGSVFLVLRNDRVNIHLPGPQLVPAEGDAEGSSEADGPLVLDSTYVYETREQYIQRMTETFGDHLASQLPNYASYDAAGELIEEGLLHGPEDLILPPRPDARSLVSIVSVNMSDDSPEITDSTGIFTTGASKIYGSLNNLYVFDEQTTPEDRVTKILKFSWEAETGGVELAAQGQVAGHMLNQFSADEHEGHLRIATTINNFRSGNWTNRSENVLFVLRDDGGVLELVGGMQNLALGEHIRSVRFMGDRAFITTFRNIDPLFALDLSDPAQPQSRGYVTMPGYNSYMQLIDENHLLTVGRNTSRVGSGPTQVSLFDIEDLGQPRLIDQYTLGRFSTSEAEADHHAFGWFAEHNVLAMPVADTHWERVDTDGDGYAETRQPVYENDLLLFSIDVHATRSSGDGIQLRGELAHDSPVRRSAFIDDVLYSVATGSVQAVSIVDPTVVFATIELAPPPASGSENPIGELGNRRPVDLIGVHRNRNFFVDLNGNGHWDRMAGGDMVYAFGAIGDLPIIGDFNGDGYDEIGVYRPSNSKFYLDLNGSGRWEGPSGGDIAYKFGMAGIDTPIIGDWDGDGIDNIGVHRRKNFFLDANGNGRWDKGSGGDLLRTMGKFGDEPVIGDWNADGRDDIGLRRNMKFFLDANGNGRWNGSGDGLDAIHVYREIGETPVPGDWKGDGKDQVGVHSARLFYLDQNDNGNWNRLAGGDMVYAFGGPDDTPFAGKWRPRPETLLAACEVRQACERDDGLVVEPLTAEALGPVVQQAINVWSSASLSPGQQQAIQQLDVRIDDLPGITLGQALGNTITIDVNAAGFGWSFETDEGRTPENENVSSISTSDFRLPHSFDLLTAVTHELGHVFGYDHQDNGVMQETLPRGIRRVWDDGSLLDHATDFGDALNHPDITPSMIDDYFATT